LSVLHNYIDNPNKISNLTKLFLDQYIAKFLDTLAKPFFLCNCVIRLKYFEYAFSIFL